MTPWIFRRLNSRSKSGVRVGSTDGDLAGIVDGDARTLRGRISGPATGDLWDSLKAQQSVQEWALSWIDRW